MDTKYCCSCRRLLPVQEFAKNASKKDGLSSQCKDCMRVSNSQYRVAKAKREKAKLDEAYQRGYEDGVHDAALRIQEVMGQR